MAKWKARLFYAVFTFVASWAGLLLWLSSQPNHGDLSWLEPPFPKAIFDGFWGTILIVAPVLLIRDSRKRRGSCSPEEF